MLAGEAFSPIQRPNSKRYLQTRSVAQRLMHSSVSLFMLGEHFSMAYVSFPA